MDRGFVSDTQVSEPINSETYSLDYNMNGFGWDTNKGMFIPVEEGLNYFQPPFPKSSIRKIPNG